ncbi:biotin--[acetyl-CoA-carboxylase] ligase [Acetobacter sp. TBRC 12305]|uniref:biotin--[biotin carboxyl-carrier protein] ligase n=1 Tax=Acetobacter garciniae TaxID=2817435 RepID=A0A939HMT2_9PROT|nr:biotin--[acetyl-CoA-carboxylase] ligase [Acetobacter garciniae]MBO1325845.1 biotin--[acetyl-CoA-carboxylase] ligase [Acetobacter garciniae]MBX0345745.1 biotin--[acetyl-CoA-carboxylase] ligase [Acetobacter garciniae]
MNVRDVSWRLECHDELPSTSDYCLQKARAGETAGLAVLARRQTRGRGSRGRQWQDAGQSLALSALLDANMAGSESLGGWPFAASMAFFEGLAASVPAARARLAIKWPNDILLDGAKLGGILIERDGANVVIGLGANLAAAPGLAEIGRRTACLAQCGDVPEVENVARAVLTQLSIWCAIWREQGFAPLRAAWLDRAHPIGTPLVVKGGSTYEEGRFAGLTADGRLMLDTDGGMKIIATGEILLAQGSA